MKLTGEQAVKYAKGAGIAALVIVGGYLAYKAVGLLSGVGAALNSAGEAIGGSVYTVINGDANLTVQSTFQRTMADLKAAGSPPVGSALYNQIVARDQS